MHRALLITGAAAGAPVVVKPVAVPGTELDHRVFRAGAQTAVALEAVATGQAPARLVDGLGLGQATDHLTETGDALLRCGLRLLARREVAEVPRVQQVELGQRVLGR